MTVSRYLPSRLKCILEIWECDMMLPGETMAKKRKKSSLRPATSKERKAFEKKYKAKPL